MDDVHAMKIYDDGALPYITCTHIHIDVLIIRA